MAEEFLVARDVSYRYAARRGVEAVSVLQRFSVSLTEGEFFCLLGPSGCGKTTVLNLMAGFLEPVSGMLTLAGRPIRASRESALWCAACIEQLWRACGQAIHADERETAHLSFLRWLYQTGRLAA